MSDEPTTPEPTEPADASDTEAPPTEAPTNAADDKPVEQGQPTGLASAQPDTVDQARVDEQVSAPSQSPAASVPEPAAPEPAAQESTGQAPETDQSSPATVAAPSEPAPEPNPVSETEASTVGAPVEVGQDADPAPDPSSAPAPSAGPAAAAAPPADKPLPKPGEEGYDPDQGLGLTPGTTALGPPNMGGFESGEIVTGTVLRVDRREAEVDLGNGKIGVVGDRHWSSGGQVDLTTVLSSGDSVDAAVLARADAKKRITLSHLWAQQKRGWQAAETAARQKGDLTGTVTELVKGGLSLDVNGIRGFMPASLVDTTTVKDLKPFVGQTFEVRVIEADRTKQRLIVSRKAALRATQRQAAKAALSDIKVGQVMQGVVAQITDFGAFVDVEGIRGLVHKSEIGWSRAQDPQRELAVGQQVEVKVIKVQPSRNRLGLSMKSGTDPLRQIRRGDRFEATVSRLVDFGAFVQLPGGVEGLVHVSEMAEYRVFAPEEIVIPGDKVAVKVLKVDKKRRTIDLSMAQAIVPDPPEEAAKIAAANEAAAAAAEAPAGKTDTDQSPTVDDAPQAADETGDDAAQAADANAAGDAKDGQASSDSSDPGATPPAIDDDYAEDQADSAASAVEPDTGATTESEQE